MRREYLRQPVMRLSDAVQTRHSDTLAAEEPLELCVAGRPLAITIRTQIHPEHAPPGLGRRSLTGTHSLGAPPPNETLRQPRCCPLQRATYMVGGVQTIPPSNQAHWYRDDADRLRAHAADVRVCRRSWPVVAAPPPTLCRARTSNTDDPASTSAVRRRTDAVGSRPVHAKPGRSYRRSPSVSRPSSSKTSTALARCNRSTPQSASERSVFPMRE
jgi:hypothetical protein